MANRAAVFATAQYGEAYMGANNRYRLTKTGFVVKIISFAGERNRIREWLNDLSFYRTRGESGNIVFDKE